MSNPAPLETLLLPAPRAARASDPVAPEAVLEGALPERTRCSSPIRYLPAAGR